MSGQQTSWSATGCGRGSATPSPSRACRCRPRCSSSTSTPSTPTPTDLVRRAGGKPIRVASKSLRVPALISRALARDGVQGVLGYTLREALWLHEQGICDDIVVAYPTVDRGALAELVASPSAAAAITLMVDNVAHLDVVDSVRFSPTVPVRVAIDVDAGLRMGGQHVGPKRSPLHDTARDRRRSPGPIVERDGFRLVGAMTYEGQVAGLQDSVPTARAKSLVVRRLKSLSLTQLAVRRREIADALAELADLEFWNAGGSGSVEDLRRRPGRHRGRRRLRAAGADAVRPLPLLRSRGRRRSTACRSPASRRPSMATVHGGGLIASGPDRPGPAADPVGARRAAPDRARGRRRGADAAHRAHRGAAGDRRPGVVPPREVRRAVRARQHRAPAVRQTSSSTRSRATAGVARPSDAPARPRPDALAATRRSAPGG